MCFISFRVQNLVWYYNCPHFTEEETEAKCSKLVKDMPAVSGKARILKNRSTSKLAIKPLHEPHFLLRQTCCMMPFWSHEKGVENLCRILMVKHLATGDTHSYNP